VGCVCSVHHRNEKCATKMLINGTTHNGRIILYYIGGIWLITRGGDRPWVLVISIYEAGRGILG